MQERVHCYFHAHFIFLEKLIWITFDRIDHKMVCQVPSDATWFNVINFIISTTFYATYGVVCCQLTHYSFGDYETILPYHITIIKSKIWFNNHCLGSSYEKVVCTVCLVIFSYTIICVCYLFIYSYWSIHYWKNLILRVNKMQAIMYHEVYANGVA